MKTSLGIDLGTQSVKVLCYDFANRNTLATASSKLEIDQSVDGKAEQQAHWWVDALCDALKEIPQKLKDSVVAIAVSGQQHGFVPLADNGEVLAPVKLWCDTSTQDECDQIMQRLGGEDNCIAISGNKISVGFTASKVLNLKLTNPECYRRMATILLPHDYLNYWLTGELCMEMGDASGTGFLDVRTRTWSQPVLTAMDKERDLMDCLPTLLNSNDVIGHLLPSVSGLTGLPSGIPIACGGGDNMMGAIGTANLSNGKATISLGTSGTIYAYSDTPIIDPTGNIAAFCSSTGGWLPLLCTMNCTVTSEILRNLLKLDLSEFDAALVRSDLGASGVLTLPFFNGERTPNLPKAKGCVLGLDSHNATSENLLRSGVEGASFALRFGLDSLAKLGVNTHQVVLTGGGANSSVWRQMIADIMNVDVLVMRNNEGAAFGAALQAYAAYEQQECTHDLLDAHFEFAPQMSCCPIPDNVLAYQHVYQNYLQAVDAISPLYLGKL